MLSKVIVQNLNVLVAQKDATWQIPHCEGSKYRNADRGFVFSVPFDVFGAISFDIG